MNSYKNKIGIIVTWFGKLPNYFPAWLMSAEANKDIDFLIFSDHTVKTDSENITCYTMTFDETISMFKKKLNREVKINNSYKFCDCRIFFGLTYADYLKDYDFWGYCDIDLMFGNIRNFLTDERLGRYERFYQYGHLSIFKNNSKINNLYDLPGGIYSYDEILCQKAKTTPEEYLGINRICDINNILWYTNIDFADFAIKYPNRLEVKHGLQNYKKQSFIWKSGCVYQIYEENDKLKERELIYMHWQKRKPSINSLMDFSKMYILTPNSIVELDDLDKLEFEKYNPILSNKEKKECKKKYNIKKIREFIKSDKNSKKMWIRQKWHMFFNKMSYL